MSYLFEQQIKIMLEFPAMPSPVEIFVPWHILGYLDIHADRDFAQDGTVIYRRRAYMDFPVRLFSTQGEPKCAYA